MYGLKLERFYLICLKFILTSLPIDRVFPIVKIAILPDLLMILGLEKFIILFLLLTIGSPFFQV